MWASPGRPTGSRTRTRVRRRLVSWRPTPFRTRSARPVRRCRRRCPRRGPRSGGRAGGPGPRRRSEVSNPSSGRRTTPHGCRRRASAPRSTGRSHPLETLEEFLRRAYHHAVDPPPEPELPPEPEPGAGAGAGAGAAGRHRISRCRIRVAGVPHLRVVQVEHERLALLVARSRRLVVVAELEVVARARRRTSGWPSGWPCRPSILDDRRVPRIGSSRSSTRGSRPAPARSSWSPAAPCRRRSRRRSPPRPGSWPRRRPHRGSARSPCAVGPAPAG